MIPTAWRRACASANNCVEVAYVEGLVVVRDSKAPDQTPLLFRPDEWAAFLDGVKGGEFDLPEACDA